MEIQKLDYHNRRSPLLFKEYGRNIQNMVLKLKLIEDKDVRNIAAEQIIKAMSAFSQTGKDFGDLQAKLWDHLFAMADYDLDVDCPFEIKKPEVEDKKSKRMAYYPYRSQLRQYGKNVELMIAKAAQIEDPETRDEYVQHIANVMKLNLSKSTNNNHVHDSVVLEHLSLLAKDLPIKSSEILLHAAPVVKNQNNNNQGFNKNKKFFKNKNNANKHKFFKKKPN